MDEILTIGNSVDFGTNLQYRSAQLSVDTQELSTEELQVLEDAMVDMVFEAGVYSLLFQQILAQVMELSTTDVINEAMDLYG